jgi:hypothetical protein
VRFESRQLRRRGSESNEVFTDCQPQYPDLQEDINADFTGLQEVSDTIRPLPDLTRHIPVAYSVIEEIVEGFVEGFLTSNFYANSSQYARILNRSTGGLPITEIAHNLSALTRNIILIS